MKSGPTSFCPLTIAFIAAFSSQGVLFTSASLQEKEIPNAHQAARKPNIILLLTDDQDVTLGGIDEMPILRREMIEKGMMFQNAFVHTPICCPSRSSILSGNYVHNGGAMNNSKSFNCYGEEWQENAEQRTFAVYAKEAGYKTSYSGKYLNTYGRGNGNDTMRVPPGWDKWLGLVGGMGYYHYNVIKSDDGGKTSHNIFHNNSYAEDYFPDVIANRTLDMIDKFTSLSDHPPFLIVNAWTTPHAPFTSAPWADHLFDGARAHRTDNWNASSEVMQQKHWLMRQYDPIDSLTESQMDLNFQHRAEALQSIDEHIRRIVEMLESKGELKNTIIIYMSDNGFSLGQHRACNQKRNLYENNIRVPFIVSGPGVPKNVTTEDVVLNIDIAPTIYELVTGSQESLPSMDGKSFIPLLDESNNPSRVDFLVSYHGQRAKKCDFFPQCPPPSQIHNADCTNNTYHCVRTLEKGGDLTVSEDSIFCKFEDAENFTEYYDLQVDKWQLQNKADTLSDGKRQRLELRLAQLKVCNGDSCRSFPVEDSQAAMYT